MKILNANWTAGADGRDGQFECLIITDDDERHVVTATAPDMAALVALARADTALLWDPPARTLIVANIVGRMPWSERARPSS